LTAPELPRPERTPAPLDQLRSAAGFSWNALAGGAALQRLWPAAAVLGGGVLLVDSLHGPVSSLFSLSAAAGGLWLLAGRLRPSGAAQPRSSEAWLERLDAVLASFERLQPEAVLDQQQRLQQLAHLKERQGRRQLDLALVGAQPWSDTCQQALLASLRCPLPLRVLRSQPLPVASERWHWPEVFRRCDAADLRWLEALPAGQPVWLLLQLAPGTARESALSELASQWPSLDGQRCLPWDGDSASLPAALTPLASWLRRSGEQQRQQTAVRVLSQLHERWQADLEQLRRGRWQQLQQRTQWLVAAGVLASPLPSLDLLVLAAANGLMLQEMARLWDCPWDLGTLRAAATELARAALALGLVEWSSQALLTAARLHGATWLVGGALQALSAAYLTRVVGRAMADYLALAAGVPEEELEALLQRQAPLLVARAAEAERLDWAGFLQQGRQWWQTLSQQIASAAQSPAALPAAPQA